MISPHLSDIKNELIFKATRSQGPGGQNVNKVNTRIELRFNIRNSRVLCQSEKQILEHFLHSRITAQGELIIVSQDSRSQLNNKQLAITRFFALLEKALTPKKKRRHTRPTRNSVRKRLSKKRVLGEKKKLRNNRNLTAE